MLQVDVAFAVTRTLERKLTAQLDTQLGYRFVQPASNWKPLLYSNSGTSSRGFSKQLSRSGRALLIYFPLFASNDAFGV